MLLCECEEKHEYVFPQEKVCDFGKVVKGHLSGYYLQILR